MLQTRSSALLAFAALIASIAVPLVLSGCTPGSSGDNPPRTERDDVLSSMGFALTDDSDPSTISGTLAAAFTAPVLDAQIASSVGDLGTAHVEFDDVTRDIDAAAIIGAYPDTDLAYAVLFEEEAPWRYVVIAAHEGAIVDGATIDLDGVNAAALVVDEETGSGYLSQSGALTVSSASLVDGGAWTGAVNAELVEVGIDAWPEALFPFSSDGAPSEQAAASGGGSFDTGTGAADVTVDVEGFASFHGTFASMEPSGDGVTSFVVITSAEERRAFVLYVDDASLAAGASLSLGGYVAGAALFEEDGTQLAFTAGTLNVDIATPLSGTVSVSGDAYVIPADEWSGEGEGEGEPFDEDCTGLESVASTFAPAHVYVDENIPAGELPEGFDTVLTFADANDSAILGVLVETGADYATTFTTVAYEGGSFPSAVLGLSTCSAYVEIDAGALDADIVIDDAGNARMIGSLTFTASDTTREVALDVEVLRY